MSLRTLEHDGVVWNVWDVIPDSAGRLRLTGFTEGMQGGWLCFESPQEKRRVVPIPEGWTTWPDEELAACLAGAAPVKRRLGAEAEEPTMSEGAPR